MGKRCVGLGEFNHLNCDTDGDGNADFAGCAGAGYQIIKCI